MPKKAQKKSNLSQGLEEALAEKKAGRVLGPFTTAQDAMRFLDASHRLLVLVEQTLREAVKLSKHCNPEAIHWLLDLEDRTLKRKLIASKRSRS